jgi:hypothetical protein
MLFERAKQLDFGTPFREYGIIGLSIATPGCLYVLVVCESRYMSGLSNGFQLCGECP